MIKIRLDVVRLVGALDFFDPDVEVVHPHLHKILKTVRLVKNGPDTTHQEGEKDEADEFEEDREDVLFGCGACVVAVADGGDAYEAPIESKDPLRKRSFTSKCIIKSITLMRPRFNTSFAI